ncbi:MAG: hypothetical protein PGN37_04220 [Mycobacterium kyogaense]|uniref:hypothetical protein n=1 Tax=Mycobacterium kyogaense TaxID=2212479 RepID=UPI002FF6DF75
MAEHADSAEVIDVCDDDHLQSDSESDSGGEEYAADAAVGRRTSAANAAIVVCGVVLIALGTVAGWLGWGIHGEREVSAQRDTMIDVARQGAVNLTTINFTEVDADIARILDSSVGDFHDDFQQRSQPFIDVVKQAQSTSVGTVTSAGLEKLDGDHGQVLVAVSVRTSNVGGQDQPPRAWRMRIDVQKIADGTYKVSDVNFVA